MRGRITAACIRVLLATIEATRKKSTSLFHVVAQLVIVRLIICMLYKGKVSTTALQALSARPLLRSFELPSLTNFKCCCFFFCMKWTQQDGSPFVCVCWIESLLALIVVVWLKAHLLTMRFSGTENDTAEQREVTGQEYIDTKTTNKEKIGKKNCYRNPSKPSSLPLIWMGMARAYALATRRLRSMTMSLAQISSSIWCHLSKTSWMWS